LNIVKSYVEAASEAVGGGALTILDGGDSWPDFGSGFLQGVVMSIVSSIVSGVAYGALIDGNDLYDGNDLSKANLQKGDIIGWGSDGSGVSRGILAASGEDFSHVGVVDEDADGFFIREATGEGKQIRTEISKYSNRPYKIYGNRQITQPFVEERTGFGFKGYNLVETNCTSQATRWTGMDYTNNPGVLYRQMNGITPFYTSSTLQGYHVW